MCRKKICVKSFLFLLLSVAVSAFAVAGSDDSQQPIHIEADKAEIDEAKGVMTYTGHVQLRQGSIEVSADTVVVYAKDGEVQRITAQGQPVRYLQKPVQKSLDEKQQKEVRGVSQRLEFTADNKQVLLLGKAEFWQGGNRFSGNRIQYDSEAGRVVANAGGDAGSPQRVTVTLQPREKGTDSQKANSSKAAAKP